jgi:hypothetical protein
LPDFSIGSTYTLSWDLALGVSIGAGSGRSFGVFLDSQTFSNALLFDEYLSATIYKSDSVNFVATSTSHTFIFAGELDNRTNDGVGNTDVSYKIDNIALNATVPEPGVAASFIALSTMGFGAFVYRRRRRVVRRPH